MRNFIIDSIMLVAVVILLVPGSIKMLMHGDPGSVLLTQIMFSSFTTVGGLFVMAVEADHGRYSRT